MAIGITTVGHFFAAAVSDVHKAQQFLTTKVQQLTTVLSSTKTQENEQTIEALTGLLPTGISGTAVNVERVLFAAAGPTLALANEAVHAVGDAAAAADAKLLDHVKDQAVADDLKQFIKDIAGTAKTIGYDFVAAAKGQAVTPPTTGQ